MPIKWPVTMTELNCHAFFPNSEPTLSLPLTLQKLNLLIQENSPQGPVNNLQLPPLLTELVLSVCEPEISKFPQHLLHLTLGIRECDWSGWASPPQLQSFKLIRFSPCPWHQERCLYHSSIAELIFPPTTTQVELELMVTTLHPAPLRFPAATTKLTISVNGSKREHCTSGPDFSNLHVVRYLEIKTVRWRHFSVEPCPIDTYRPPPNLTELRGFFCTPHTLTSVQLPSTLKVLHLHDQFDLSIDDIKMPDTLEELAFGNSFQYPLHRVSFPSHLKHIHFGLRFNQPLADVVFPPHLRKLTFHPEAEFQQPLSDPSTSRPLLSATLKELRLGRHYFCSLSGLTIPTRMQVLELGRSSSGYLRLSAPSHLREVFVDLQWSKTAAPSQNDGN